MGDELYEAALGFWYVSTAGVVAWSYSQRDDCPVPAPYRPGILHGCLCAVELFVLVFLSGRLIAGQARWMHVNMLAGMGYVRG